MAGSPGLARQETPERYCLTHQIAEVMLNMQLKGYSTLPWRVRRL